MVIVARSGNNDVGYLQNKVIISILYQEDIINHHLIRFSNFDPVIARHF